MAVIVLAGAIAAVAWVLIGAHSRHASTSGSAPTTSIFKVVHFGSFCRAASGGKRVRMSIVVRNAGAVAGSPPLRLSIRLADGTIERAATPASPPPSIAGGGVRTIRVDVPIESRGSALRACLVAFGDEDRRRYSIAVRDTGGVSLVFRRRNAGRPA